MACATAPPPPPPAPIVFTEVPQSALNAMCLRLHDEGMERETAVDVISTSRPLITDRALAAIAASSFFRGHVSQQAVDRAYAMNATALPVVMTNACSLHPIGANERLPNDTMVVEFSAPFPDPFSRGGNGVLARLSLGGEGATWYWIPLVNRGGTWAAGQAVPLGVRD